MNSHKPQAESFLVYTFILLFYISFIQSYTLLGLTALVLVAYSIISLRAFRIHVFILPVLPFIILMAISLVLNQALNPEVDLWGFQIRIMAKVALSSIVLGTIIDRSSNLELLEGILNLGLPPFLNQIFALTFRYFYMIQADISVGRQALYSRGLANRGVISTITVFGEWIGGFFLKSSNHGDQVYQAMKSRGFKGAPKGSVLVDKKLIAKALGLIVCLGLVLVVERRLPHVY